MLRGLLFAAFVAASVAPGSASGIDGPDAGNWTVGECILAQFAMEFTVYPNVSDTNQTMVIDVPADDAKVSNKSHCGDQSQALSLYWTVPAKNDSSFQLDRNVTVVFSVKPNETYYGVSRLFATFVLAKWKVNDTVHHSSIVIDSGDIPNLMFHTPLDRSYLCADVGHLELKTVLKFPDSPNPPPDGTKLPNSTIIGRKVQFDAFRDHGTVLPGFRTPMDCDYMPNDIVPIAVGITLALLIVFILIFYIIGRRRQRFAGYESV